MRRWMIASLLAVPAPAAAQAIEPGRWDVTSTVADIAVPGLPAFLQRMARGHRTAEHKQLAAGQGIEALLMPDPKARCTVESQQVAAGRYAQAIVCPQKRGTPLRVSRAGSYDASGFTGQATVSGSTPKGALRIVLDQKAARVGG